MLQNIIGRKREIELIKNCVSSNKPEFIAIYGRRRIGKTYLHLRFKTVMPFKRSLGDHVMGNWWTRDEQRGITRRATSAQTNGYDLGNASIIISRFFDRLIHLIESDLLFFCNMISENLLISNYTQQIDTCRNALQRKRGLISIYLLRLFKQTAAYLIKFDVSQATTGNW